MSSPVTARNLLVACLVACLVVVAACDRKGGAGGSATSPSIVPDTTPEGTLTRFLDACVRAGSEDEGARAQAMRDIQALALPIREDGDWATRPTNRTFVERLQAQPWIFRSYAPGATPANGYAAPASFAPEITSRREEAGMLKLWIRSGGADSPRPVSMKRPDGDERWYVQEWSSVYVEIRRPK